MGLFGCAGVEAVKMPLKKCANALTKMSKIEQSHLCKIIFNNREMRKTKFLAKGENSLR